MSTTNNTVTSSNTSSILDAARAWKKPEKTKKGRISILEKHKDTIRYLRCNRHFSYSDIAKFFNEQGIKTTYANLLQFVRNNKIGLTSKKKKIVSPS